MSRILVTGGAGFVGSHLVNACVGAGHQVHVVLREGSDGSRLVHLGSRIFTHRFDLRSDGELRRCIADVAPEIVFHLAASPRRLETSDLSDAKDSITEDLECLVGLLGAAAIARHPPRCLVRAGSLAEYGAVPAPYEEDGREAPVTVYGAGVLAGTRYAAVLQSRLPFPVATARLALVYGPSQSTAYFVPALVRQCLAGEISRVRRPHDRRDLIYVDDVVAGLMAMATAKLSGATVLNISTGVAPTMAEVAGLVTALTGADPDQIRFDHDAPPNGAADLRASPDRARRLLGWRSRTALADGLRRTIAWYRGESEAESRRNGVHEAEYQDA